MAEEKRKNRHCNRRICVGGPYMGNGGNNGFVLAGGIESLNGASGACDPEDCEGRGLMPCSEPLFACRQYPACLPVVGSFPATLSLS